MKTPSAVSPGSRARALSQFALAFVFLAGAALAASPALAALPGDAASGQVRTTSSTGLFTLHEGHSVALTLVETGGSAARPSGVVLELVNASDTVIARTQGELRPGQPVRLAFDAPPTHGTGFRARARLVTATENLASAPILTLEVFNDQTLDSFAIESCRMKYDPKGTSGEVLGNCGGCETSSETDF